MRMHKGEWLSTLVVEQPQPPGAIEMTREEARNISVLKAPFTKSDQEITEQEVYQTIAGYLNYKVSYGKWDCHRVKDAYLTIQNGKDESVKDMMKGLEAGDKECEEVVESVSAWFFSGLKNIEFEFDHTRRWFTTRILGLQDP